MMRSLGFMFYLRRSVGGIVDTMSCEDVECRILLESTLERLRTSRSENQVPSSGFSLSEYHDVVQRENRSET